MPCEQIGNVILCYNNAYRYKHNGKIFYFEISPACGPIPLTRDDLEPRKTIPSGFWDAFEEFDNLSDEEKENHLILDY